LNGDSRRVSAFENTDAALVRRIKEDFHSAGLDAKTVGLLDFAEKLTVSPYAIVDEDVERLRGLGWDEDQIVLATHVVGIFNYLVRLADAFGIEWEPEVRASATHQPELWQSGAK
jgi:alkylhydroperoxidase family enzyme